MSLHDGLFIMPGPPRSREQIGQCQTVPRAQQAPAFIIKELPLFCVLVAIRRERLPHLALPKIQKSPPIKIALDSCLLSFPFNCFMLEVCMCAYVY